MATMPTLSSYTVQNNPFEALYLDLTDRCNMSCHLCYSNSRAEGRDMDVPYFEEVCRTLPGSVFFRYVGGEPALHPRFFDFIKIGHAYNHHVQFSSNGLVFNDDDFLNRLEPLNGSFVPSMTLDGGTSNSEAYLAINGADCLEMKLRALENLHRFGIKRVALTAIIARGLNEQTIPELFELADRYKEMVRFIHFRTAARVGRFVETKPYTMEELRELVRPHFSPQEFTPGCIGEIHCTPDEHRHCCYRFRPSRRLQVPLIEFASERSAQCPKRGKLLDDLTVVPFFEHMMAAS